MTLWELVDRHLAAAIVMWAVTVVAVVFCFLARLIWNTEDAVTAVGKKLVSWASEEKGPRA